MKRKQLLTLLALAMSTSSFSQTPEILSIRKYREEHTAAIMKEYVDFLSISNTANDAEGLKSNTQFIMRMMEQRGIHKVQLLEANTPNTPPVVYGEVNTPGATQTLIFYAHYDGQPVNPAQWAKGLQPFQPKLYTNAIDKNGEPITFPSDNKSFLPDYRIYARGASDDKAGVAAILNAYQAIKYANLSIPYNLKFFFEGEEEAGSPHLDEILKKYAPQLQSDLWVICDGPVHQSGKKQIVFGVRGDTHVDLTVYASKRPLHSGHYGNWAPNPAMQLATLLASMKNEKGRVSIKGFYDDVTPLSPSEKKALQEVPPVDEQMKAELGFNTAEMQGMSLGESINLPSLNINGIQSGNVGKLASNQIPTFATAVLDLRLVLGNDWKRQQQKVIDHIKAQGFHVTDKEPTEAERKQYAKLIKVQVGNDGMNAQRTPMDLPIAQKVIKAVKTTTTDQVVLQPTMGGSLPLYLFEQILKARTITVPIANHDNNQHAENENIRLKNFFEGIETMAALMLMK